MQTQFTNTQEIHTRIVFTLAIAVLSKALAATTNCWFHVPFHFFVFSFSELLVFCSNFSSGSRNAKSTQCAWPYLMTVEASIADAAMPGIERRVAAMQIEWPGKGETPPAIVEKPHQPVAPIACRGRRTNLNTGAPKGTVA